MPHIPQEILDKIIGYANAYDFGYYSESRPQFSNRASFVSHTFHQIVLPYKFSSLTFKIRHRMKTDSLSHWISRDMHFFPTATPPDSVPKFCEAIDARNAHALSLAPLVQELCLLGHFIAPEPEININGVVCFKNLTKLRMEDCLTTPTIMEQLGKLVHLQSLHTLRCQGSAERLEEHREHEDRSYNALSSLKSLHTLECHDDFQDFCRYLTRIPIKNLRVLKSSDLPITKALLTSDPPVQLEELYIAYHDDYSLLWNYLARMTSLTHLSLPDLELSDGPPSLIFFPFKELQYLHINVAFAPRFADQPLKRMIIDTQGEKGELMVEIRQHWRGTVFPHVEYLEVNRPFYSWQETPIEFKFWREFLLNVKKVVISNPNDVQIRSASLTTVG